MLTCQRKFGEAQACYEQAAVIVANFVPAYHNLGNLLRVQGRLEEALRGMSKLSRCCPTARTPTTTSVGNVALARMRSRSTQAFGVTRQALRCRAQCLPTAATPGEARLKQQGQFDAPSITTSKRWPCSPITPTPSTTWGTCCGIRDMSRRPWPASIGPSNSNPTSRRHTTIAPRRKTFQPDDPDLGRLEALAADPHRQHDHKMVYIHFGLGKAWKTSANTIAPASNGSKATRSAEVDALRRAGRAENFLLAARYSPAQLFQQFPDAGDPSATPIFVLGMPRSGTTLIEQILASHSSVHGGGELPFMGQVACNVRNPAGQIVPFPLYLQAPTADGLRRLGRAYLDKLPPLPEGKTRITDKMPANFLYVGLIRLILPNAKIIHTVRDPVDTCISCFSRLFTVGQGFSYDLGELGRYYRHYHELMDHWRKVLPPGTMLDVRYEDVVNRSRSKPGGCWIFAVCLGTPPAWSSTRTSGSSRRPATCKSAGLCIAARSHVGAATKNISVRCWTNSRDWPRTADRLAGRFAVGGPGQSARTQISPRPPVSPSP